MATITLNDAGGTPRTLICPTACDSYAAGTTNLLNPIDGTAIAQVSNNRDTYGTKNDPRVMEWDLLATTAPDSEYTMTLAQLKALEGQDTVLTTTYFGYTGTQNIKVINVDLIWEGYWDSLDWFNVRVTFLHR